MEFQAALFTLWCMTNLRLCREHMNEISDTAMQATNNHSFPFMLNLYNEVAPLNKSSNILISPISVVGLLGMIAASSQRETHDEITKVLGWNKLNEVAAYTGMSRTINILNSKNSENDSTIILGNSIYIQNNYRILRKFSNAMTQYFGVKDFLKVDFANPNTRDVINARVSQRTNGLIKESIPANTLTSNTRLVFCNILYFRATWEKQFSELFTIDSNFRISKDENVIAPLMYQSETFNYGIIDDIRAEVVELPYKNINTSMYILLPDMTDANDDPLFAFNRMKVKVSQNKYIISKVDSYLQSKKVLLTIPKFQMTRDYDLEDYLPNLGISKVFGSKADLSGITGRNTGLYISSVLHKSSINVDEKGSVGAAVTSGVASYRDASAKNFYANRPFAFYICNKVTKAVLFFGQLVDPTKTS